MLYVFIYHSEKLQYILHSVRIYYNFNITNSVPFACNSLWTPTYADNEIISYA